MQMYPSDMDPEVAAQLDAERVILRDAHRAFRRRLREEAEVAQPTRDGEGESDDG